MGIFAETQEDILVLTKFIIGIIVKKYGKLV